MDLFILRPPPCLSCAYLATSSSISFSSAALSPSQRLNIQLDSRYSPIYIILSSMSLTFSLFNFTIYFYFLSFFQWISIFFQNLWWTCENWFYLWPIPVGFQVCCNFTLIDGKLIPSDLPIGRNTDFCVNIYMHWSYESNGSSIIGSRLNCGELIILIVVIGQKEALLLLSFFFIYFEYFNFAIVVMVCLHGSSFVFCFCFCFCFHLEYTLSSLPYFQVSTTLIYLELPFSSSCTTIS